MKSIYEVNNGSLILVQVAGLETTFELRAGEQRGQAVGVLYCDKPYYPLATSRTFEGEWVFHRVGLLRKRRVVVQEKGSGVDIATIRFDWNDEGTFTLGTGIFRWEAINRRGFEWAFKEADGMVVLNFKPKLAMLSAVSKHQVHIELKARPFPGLSLLVMLGCFLIIQRIEGRPAQLSTLMPH